MNGLGKAIKRVLNLNKQLNSQNEHLNSCVEALEEDLQVGFSKFKSIVESQGLNKQRGRTKETLLKAQ